MHSPPGLAQAVAIPDIIIHRTFVRLEPEGDSFFFLHKIDYDKTKKNSNFSFLRQKTYVTYLNNISVIYQNNCLDEILMIVSKKW